MTYKNKSKNLKKKSYAVDLEKKNLQTEINSLLFKKTSNKNPKLLTVIVRSDKEHFFHFLKNETEFEVQGKWHSKKGKVFEENNEEITIQYFDDDKGSITKQLKSKFKKYNKRYVKEEVLYTTTTPLEMTSLM
jgi:hypothetical protein